MAIMRIQFQTEEPVLATALFGDPNSSQSYPYIPGSALRGMLIGRYLRHLGQTTLDAGDPTAQRLFFSGHTRFLNAYPVINQQRSLPVPRSWVRLGESVYDVSVDGALPDRPDAATPAWDKPKPVAEEWCVLNGITAFAATTERHLNVHTQRNRLYGRGIEGSGAVFRYDAIAPQQRFEAAIVGDPHDLAMLRDLLPDQCWFGGSRSAGYGRTRISLPDGAGPVAEVLSPLRERLATAPDRLTITLLSDLIVRDSAGQTVLGLSAPLLGLPAALGPLQLDPARSRIGQAVVGGFNQAWGLPLPQTIALVRGSVLVFSITHHGAMTHEAVYAALVALEERGIGERRAEGYGRVAFNWHTRDPELAITLAPPAAHLPAQAPASAAPEARDLAQMMAERLLRTRLDQWLVAQLASLPAEPLAISPSQLARLWITARRALTESQRRRTGAPAQPPQDLIMTFLRQLPQNARQQFENTILRLPDSTTTLGRWVGDLFDPTRHDGRITIEPVLVAGVQRAVDADLATEYRIRLIMAYAKKMRKAVTHD